MWCRRLPGRHHERCDGGVRREPGGAQPHTLVQPPACTYTLLKTMPTAPTDADSTSGKFNSDLLPLSCSCRHGQPTLVRPATPTTRAQFFRHPFGSCPTSVTQATQPGVFAAPPATRSLPKDRGKSHNISDAGHRMTLRCGAAGRLPTGLSRIFCGSASS